MIQHEHYEQVAVFEWAAYNTGKHPELAFMFAVPNGGQRNVIVATRMKAEGVKRGVPDIWLPVVKPVSGYAGLVIELKADGGKPSREQRMWLEFLEQQGYRAMWLVGADAAINEIEQYLEMV